MILKLEGPGQRQSVNSHPPVHSFIVTNERISRIHEMMEDENREAALTLENDETEEEIIREEKRYETVEKRSLTVISETID